MCTTLNAYNIWYVFSTLKNIPSNSTMANFYDNANFYEKSKQMEAKSVHVDIRPNRNIRLYHHVIDRSYLTIFIIHGSMGTYFQFVEMISYLESMGCYNVLSYEALGCGKSAKPYDSTAYNTEELLLDLLEVFKLYATKSTIVIAHSYGTCQAARLYNRIENKESIKSMILLSTADKVSTHPIFSIPLLFLRCLQPWLNRQFNQIAYSPSTSDKVKEMYESISVQNDMFVAKSFYSQFEWCEDSDWLSIACPILIIQGRDDNITALPLATALFNRYFSESTINKLLIIDAAGHQVFMEQPDLVHGVISEHLKDVGAQQLM